MCLYKDNACVYIKTRNIKTLTCMCLYKDKQVKH